MYRFLWGYVIIPMVQIQSSMLLDIQPKPRHICKLSFCFVLFLRMFPALPDKVHHFLNYITIIFTFVYQSFHHFIFLNLSCIVTKFKKSVVLSRLKTEKQQFLSYFFPSCISIPWRQPLKFSVVCPGIYLNIFRKHDYIGIYRI